MCFGNNYSCALCQPNEVISLTLIDASNSTDIRVLNAKDTIRKDLLPQFSIRADICAAGGVGSVEFELGGSTIRTGKSGSLCRGR
ncbi:MAG: hypothetical protein U5L96_16760 [Owenweeksia sp.]|nr:hypothetical protein [Owenweeksia sp.]